jgi:hypothetical protein
MGKSKAPEYQKTTTSTGGLFGQATNDKTGSNFKAEGWQKNMGSLGSNLINQSLAGLSSNDYSQDPNFQVYQDNFNRGMQQAYDTNVLGNLTDRGLMRSSGLQAATNSFNNTMQQGLADLYDSYYNRQQNNLNSALNAQNNLYSWIMGVNQDAAKNSQAVSNHYMEAYKADQARKAAMYQAIGQAVGGIGQGIGGVASAAAMASDVNVKENIKKIGEKNGFNWYEFTYKKGLGLPEGKQEGVIAQEVEQVMPEAVLEINGIKHVDYSKILGDNGGVAGGGAV